MSRVPIVGGDADQWGTILNDYLGVSLAPDGTLAPALVIGGDTNLYRAAAGQLRTDGQFRAGADLVSLNADLWARFGLGPQVKMGDITGGGIAGLQFGLNADVNLYRLAAGLLQTDGDLLARAFRATTNRGLEIAPGAVRDAWRLQAWSGYLTTPGVSLAVGPAVTYGSGLILFGWRSNTNASLNSIVGAYFSASAYASSGITKLFEPVIPGIGAVAVAMDYQGVGSTTPKGFSINVPAAAGAATVTVVALWITEDALLRRDDEEAGVKPAEGVDE